MRFRSTRTPEVAGPAGPPPRDSEALEHVLAALDAGVTGDADAHRCVVRALGEALELDVGADGVYADVVGVVEVVAEVELGEPERNGEGGGVGGLALGAV